MCGIHCPELAAIRLCGASGIGSGVREKKMATARRGNSKLFFATFGKKADLGGIALKFRTSGFCVLWAAALTAFAIPAVAADIKVLCDSPLQPAISKVADLFRQETHNELHLVFDPSPAVKKRIEEGEAADVVIVQPEFVEELSRAGKVDASSHPLIGRVGIGLGNRRDSPAYDI